MARTPPPPVPDNLEARPLVEQIAYWYERGDNFPAGPDRAACYAKAKQMVAERNAASQARRQSFRHLGPRLKP